VRTNVLERAALECLQDELEQAAGARPAQRFHHISTDEVYGSLHDEREEAFTKTPATIQQPYAASKAASDHLVRASIEPTACRSPSRLLNNYGPRQAPEKLIPLTVLKPRRARAPCTAPEQPSRLALRGRHCEAVWAVIERGAPGGLTTSGWRGAV